MSPCCRSVSQGREIIFTNIGNPHSVGQEPISYYRQVMSLCDLPTSQGIDHPKIQEIYPADVVERARSILGAIGNSGTGAYTGSQVSGERPSHLQPSSFSPSYLSYC